MLFPNNLWKNWTSTLKNYELDWHIHPFIDFYHLYSGPLWRQICTIRKCTTVETKIQVVSSVIWKISYVMSMKCIVYHITPNMNYLIKLVHILSQYQVIIHSNTTSIRKIFFLWAYFFIKTFLFLRKQKLILCCLSFTLYSDKGVHVCFHRPLRVDTGTIQSYSL